MKNIAFAGAFVTFGLMSASGATAQLGTNYCTANPNSTGVPAAVSATGTTQVLFNNLTLQCTSLPPASFGYFLTSQSQGFVPMYAGSSGNLCLASPIGRYSTAVQT